MATPHAQAIQAALENNWERAITCNQDILAQQPEDIEALNRMAYAYSRIGDFAKACSVYRKVLVLDHYNAIALKNLHKFNKQPKMTKKHVHDHEASVVSPTLFLEEPGKTKVVTLINVAPTGVLIALKVGQPVHLFPKGHKVEVRDEKKNYLGALPDDLSFHLKKLMRLGNRYAIFVKGVGKNTVSVFVKETKRSKRNSVGPTFTINSDTTFYPFVRKDLLRDDEDGSDESRDEE